jgi:hypothetical protein
MEPPSWLQGGDVGVPIELDIHCGDQHVELPGRRGDIVWIAGIDGLVGPKIEGLRFFGLAGGECRHFTSPRVEELQRHVAEPSDTDHRHPVGRFDTKLDQRIKDSNATAEQRPGTLEIDVAGQGDNAGGMRPNLVGKAAVAADNGGLGVGAQVVVTTHAGGAGQTIA